MCVVPWPVFECERMDDPDVLTASDVTSPDVECKVLDLTRYPEACAVTNKNELEAQRARDVKTERGGKRMRSAGERRREDGG